MRDTLQMMADSTGKMRWFKNGKPAPPYTGVDVFKYVPSWMGGEENPNAELVRFTLQIVYFLCVLLAVYFIACWHKKHTQKL